MAKGKKNRPPKKAATPPKYKPAAPPKPKPSVQKGRKAVKKTVKRAVSREEFIFGKTNYMYMLGGAGLLALGLILMSGGKMPSPDVWDDGLIYSFRRITLAPMLMIAGLILLIVSIFKKDKSAPLTEPQQNQIDG